MFEIILKELKLLNLDQIFQIEILEEFQRRLYFTEIKRTIHNLIEGNLNLGEESTKFVNNLLVSLKIPYVIENEDKPNKFIQKFLDFKNKIKSHKLLNFKNAVKSNKYKIINSLKADLSSR
jgi:hypothetical protein